MQNAHVDEQINPGGGPASAESFSRQQPVFA